MCVACVELLVMCVNWCRVKSVSFLSYRIKKFEVYEF
jgi:hypothetical protein